jgi:hypothetical protein
MVGTIQGDRIGQLFSLGSYFLWAIIFFGRLFSLGDYFLWAIIFFGRLFSLGEYFLWTIIFIGQFVENLKKEVHILGILFFLSIIFDMIYVGQHFGRFFHKLIWSPWNHRVSCTISKSV